MSIKTLIIHFILKFFRSTKSALKTALSLAQIGEFSFAIFVSASEAKLFETSLDFGLLSVLQEKGIIHFSSQDIHQFLVLMAVFSMVATPFILKNLDLVTEYFLKKKAISKAMEEAQINIPLLNHIIVAGYGSFGSAVVEELKKKNLDYIAIDYDIARVEIGEKHKDRIIFGDVTKKSFLKKFSLDEAKCIIIAIDNTSIVHAICENILEIAPKIDIIAKVDSEVQEVELKDLEVSSINARSEIAKLLVKYAIKE